MVARVVDNFSECTLCRASRVRANLVSDSGIRQKSKWLVDFFFFPFFFLPLAVNFDRQAINPSQECYEHTSSVQPYTGIHVARHVAMHWCTLLQVCCRHDSFCATFGGCMQSCTRPVQNVHVCNEEYVRYVRDYVFGKIFVRASVLPR